MAFVRLLLASLLLLAVTPARAAAPTLKPLSVYFLDVGQGDSALIVAPSGKTVLIDGGPPEASDRLVARVRQLVQGPLDLVILTHPHLDHLGGLAKVIQAVGARRYMDSGFDHPSEAYRKLLEVVGHDVGQVMTPQPNPSAPGTLLTIGLGEGATLTILSPRVPQESFLKDTRSDPNANSIVSKLTYGQTAFLFVGDAEPETEAALLRKPIDFTSTVLKVAHHGGRYSSTTAFLAAVQPQAAVISCGVHNDYGHPTAEALQRLGAVGAHIFRTDQQGEVHAVSDGNRVTLTAQKGGDSITVPGRGGGPVALGLMPTGGANASGSSSAQAPTRSRASPPEPTAPGGDSAGQHYVSLKGSDVFHREDCSTLKRSKNQERTVYPDRASALRERRPAKDCNP